MLLVNVGYWKSYYLKKLACITCTNYSREFMLMFGSCIARKCNTFNWWNLYYLSIWHTIEQLIARVFDIDKRNVKISRSFILRRTTHKNRDIKEAIFFSYWTKKKEKILMLLGTAIYYDFKISVCLQYSVVYFMYDILASE